jgi:hypothetical protein
VLTGTVHGTISPRADHVAPGHPTAEH